MKCVESFCCLFIREPIFPIGELVKYVIIYWSRYGNGKKLVDYLAGKLEKKKAEIQIFKTDEADPATMPEADMYVFSAPTEAFNIQKDMKKFMKKLKGMKERKYGIINTHGMKKNCLHKMEKLLSKNEMMKVAGVDFQVGDGSRTGNGLMENWKVKIDEFAEKL